MKKESTEYQKFFQKALKKFGVSSPDELKGEKEKSFYDYVDKNWEGDKEEPEANESIIDVAMDRITEALSASARLAAKARMRRLSSVLTKKRVIQSKKSASSDVIMRRAEKKAHDLIMQKRILHNREKENLSPAEKSNIEKKMQAYQPAIKKLAKKLFSKVKAADITRRQSLGKAASGSKTATAAKSSVAKVSTTSTGRI